MNNSKNIALLISMKPMVVKFLLIVFSLTLSLPAFAEDRPKECRKTWLDANRMTISSYEKCSDSVGEYYWWINFSDCIKNDEGRGIGGGCAHLASNSSKYTPTKEEFDAQRAHCDLLKPTKKMVQDYYQQLLTDRKLTNKCQSITWERYSPFVRD